MFGSLFVALYIAPRPIVLYLNLQFNFQLFKRSSRSSDVRFSGLWMLKRAQKRRMCLSLSSWTQMEHEWILRLCSNYEPVAVLTSLLVLWDLSSHDVHLFFRYVHRLALTVMTDITQPHLYVWLLCSWHDIKLLWFTALSSYTQKFSQPLIKDTHNSFMLVLLPDFECSKCHQISRCVCLVCSEHVFPPQIHPN